MSRHPAVLLAVALLASSTACELVVDDGTRSLASADAGGDVADASCQQGCSAAQASCLSACQKGPDHSGCQNQCTQTATSCGDACRSQCDACFAGAACAGVGACSD